MKTTIRTILLLSVLTLFAGCSNRPSADTGFEPNGRWTKEKAKEWSERTGWRSGCNYVTSTAVNQIEMWMKDTYDPQTIDKELGWAQELGFTAIRVYLHSAVWTAEKEGFLDTIDNFLSIADSHGIKTIFIFFDDCWNPDSEYGPQPEPKVGVHNSQWVRDPSDNLRDDPDALFPVLKEYVQAVIGKFKDDDRVLWWDLYNEPGNSEYYTKSLPLLKAVFAWAREMAPSQPLSSGVWHSRCPEVNNFQIENSDIFSYHNYREKDYHLDHVLLYKAFMRPMYCTEYMARTEGSLFQTILPMLKEHNVSAINFGLVSGKINTIYGWSDVHPDGEEPEVWFHDILRPDKTPFDPEEIELIKKINGKQ